MEKNRNNRKVQWIGPLAAVLLTALSSGAHAENARRVSGLQTPESVLATKDGKVYVSEINEFGKDGDGRVSEITADGKIKPFAIGLDDPKGLTTFGKDIYVTDKVRVIKIAPDGTWKVLAAADAFPAEPQFLNDIEADAEGNLYVSDSGNTEKGSGGAIYRISPAGKVTLVINGAKDNRVLAPNGLVVKNGGKTLLYVDFVSGILYSLDVKTKALKKIADGFGAGDGLVETDSGIIYVSDWKGGQVFRLNREHRVEVIKTGYQTAADLALARDGHTLIVPDMKGGMVEWLPLQQ